MEGLPNGALICVLQQLDLPDLLLARTYGLQIKELIETDNSVWEPHVQRILETCPKLRIIFVVYAYRSNYQIFRRIFFDNVIQLITTFFNLNDNNGIVLAKALLESAAEIELKYEGRYDLVGFEYIPDRFTRVNECHVRVKQKVDILSYMILRAKIMYNRMVGSTFYRTQAEFEGFKMLVLGQTRRALLPAELQ